MARLIRYKGKIYEQIAPKTSSRKSFVDVPDEEKFGWAVGYSIKRELDKFKRRYNDIDALLNDIRRLSTQNKNSNGDIVNFVLARADDNSKRNCIESSFELKLNNEAIKTFEIKFEYQSKEGNEIAVDKLNIEGGENRFVANVAESINRVLVENYSKLNKMDREKAKWAVASYYEKAVLAFFNKFVGRQFISEDATEAEIEANRGLPTCEDILNEMRRAHFEYEGTELLLAQEDGVTYKRNNYKNGKSDGSILVRFALRSRKGESAFIQNPMIPNANHPNIHLDTISVDSGVEKITKCYDIFFKYAITELYRHKRG